MYFLYILIDTKRCLSFKFSHTNHCKNICAIAETNVEKLTNLEKLKWDLLKYYFLGLLKN